MQHADGVLSATERMSAAELVAYCLRLEALGYAELWLPDIFGREIFATAGFVLSRTERLRVATGIANVYGRDATTTAHAARTLSELYDGRFILGLGVSHPQVAMLRGHTWEPPARKLRSYLAGIAAATVRSPEPAQRAPIYLAAHGPALLKLAAERADGANTYLMPPEHARRAREILGPDRALNVVLPCCLCEDAERARDVGRRGIAMYLALPAYQRQWAHFGLDTADLADGGSDRLIDDLVAWGSAAALRERIAVYREAGADRIVVVPYNPEPKSTLPPWPLLEALVPTPA